MQGKLNSVPVPPRIAQQPGHYSIVGLLPEDHTFSKGMLFLLQPGTKCVIFDVDGAPLPSIQCKFLSRDVNPCLRAALTAQCNTLRMNCVSGLCQTSLILQEHHIVGLQVGGIATVKLVVIRNVRGCHIYMLITAVLQAP